MAVDWLKIKNEYINGGGSYRKLAEKHGVSFDTLRRRAKRENWQDLREKQCHKIATKAAQKTAEKIAEKEANRVAKLLSVSDQLVVRIEQAIKELDQTQVINKRKTKITEYKNDRAPQKPTKEIVTEKEEIISTQSIVDRRGLQQVAIALKTVWDIAGENEADKPPEVEDDGLLEALGANAKNLFKDGDDSGMLPKEKNA